MKTWLVAITTFLALSNIGYPQKFLTGDFPVIENDQTFTIGDIRLTDDEKTVFWSRNDNVKFGFEILSSTRTEGVWSEPKVLVRTRVASISGLSINGAGSKVFFSALNEDVYPAADRKSVKIGNTLISKEGYFRDLHFIAKIDEYNWTTPRPMLGLERSTSKTKEFRSDPVIDKGEKLVVFLNYTSHTSELLFSRKNDQNIWGPQKEIVFKDQGKVPGLTPEYLNDGLVLFNSLNGNYFSTIENDSVSAPVKIDFDLGQICWISPDRNRIYVFLETGKLAVIENENLIPKEQVIVANKQKAQPQLAQRSDSTLHAKPKSFDYYALIIGVSDYVDPSLDLEYPVQDAAQLKQVLTTRYSFEPNKVFTLNNPSRRDILSQLYQLRTVVGRDDNLLIFFAGHGYWDSKAEQGYWWPADASPKEPSNWLSNSDLREQIRGLETQHTLLITDACFSGGIFKLRGPQDIREADIEYQVLSRYPSRRAITSGNMTPVPDKSVFIRYLLKSLNENEARFIPSHQLFAELRMKVIGNSLHVPQEGVIADTGDEGGDFFASLWGLCFETPQQAEMKIKRGPLARVCNACLFCLCGVFASRPRRERKLR